ncbi:MAG: hypothetical protein Kow00121_02780 [Elainellaceae cyanobacterium]
MQFGLPQTLQNAFVRSHTGHYQLLKETLQIEPPRTLAALGIKTDATTLKRIFLDQAQAVDLFVQDQAHQQQVLN